MKGFSPEFGRRMLNLQRARQMKASALPAQIIATFEACVRSTFVHGNEASFEITHPQKPGVKARVQITIVEEAPECVGQSDKT